MRGDLTKYRTIQVGNKQLLCNTEWREGKPGVAAGCPLGHRVVTGVCGPLEDTGKCSEKPLGELNWKPLPHPGREYQNPAPWEREGLPCFNDEVSSISSVRKL